ncbi:hypothetical protein ACFLS1_12760 [Verrucomicrobiota bacterium]
MKMVLANAFPVAGVWMYTFMAIVAIILIPIFPFILRRRRRKAQQELHDKVEKAKADILEDGIVEGPKGPYVRHKSWGVGTRLPPSSETVPPKTNAYHGGPWA